ncbi:thermonuclease family protein [Bacillus sp. 3A_MP1]
MFMWMANPVQETLLKEGLARVAYVYEPNTKYIDLLKKDEQEAK